MDEDIDRDSDEDANLDDAGLAMSQDDFELSQTMKKQKLQSQSKGASPPQKMTSPEKVDMVSVDDQTEQSIAFIEESVEMSRVSGNVTRDMLASGSNQGIQFEHTVERSPTRDQAHKEVQQQLNKIQPQFDNSYQRKTEMNQEQKLVRPQTAKGRPGARQTSAKPTTPIDVANA